MPDNKESDLTQYSPNEGLEKRKWMWYWLLYFLLNELIGRVIEKSIHQIYDNFSSVSKLLSCNEEKAFELRKNEKNNEFK